MANSSFSRASSFVFFDARTEKSRVEKNAFERSASFSRTGFVGRELIVLPSTFCYNLGASPFLIYIYKCLYQIKRRVLSACVQRNRCP